MNYSLFRTTWGWFGFVASEDGLVATFLPRSAEETKAAIRRQWPEAVESPRLMPSLRQQVIDYFDGQTVAFDVKLDLSETPPFRREALKACRRIPYGKTASYQDLARAVGQPGAARAVGGAMARNPLPIVVPCHRVLRSDGSLGGFSSPDGVDEKQRLLDMEVSVSSSGTFTKRSRRALAKAV